MGNSQKGLTFQQNFKQVKKQQHKILGLLRFLCERKSNNISIVKEYRFASSIQFDNLVQKFKRRKLLTHGRNSKASKCLININDFKIQQLNEMCGITYHVYVFIQNLDTDLSTLFYQKQRKRLNFCQQQIKQILVNVVTGLILVYDNNMKSYQISKDSIMVQNSILDGVASYKLIDMDMSSACHPYYQILNLSTVRKGNYLSPQLLDDLASHNKDPYMTPKADVFSLGMVLLQLCLMEQLDSLYDYQNYEINMEYLYQKIQSSKLSQQLKDILIEMLAIQPQDRIGLVSLRQKICPNYKEQTLRNIRTRSNSQFSGRKFSQSGSRNKLISYNKGNENKNKKISQPINLKGSLNKLQRNSLSINTNKSFNANKISVMKTIETVHENSTIFYHDDNNSAVNLKVSNKQNTTQENSSSKKIFKASQIQNNVKSIDINIKQTGLAQQKSRNSIGFKSTKFIKNQLQNQSIKKSQVFNVDYDQMESEIKSRIDSVLKQTNRINRQESKKILQKQIFINPSSRKIEQSISLSLDTPSEKFKQNKLNFDMNDETPIRKIQALKFTQEDSSEQKQNVITSVDFKLSHPVNRLKNQPVEKYNMKKCQFSQFQINLVYKVINLQNGYTYQGEVNQDNEFHGTGVLYYPNRKIKYSGAWKKNCYEGLGVLHNYESCQVSPDYQVNYDNFRYNPQNIWNSYQGGFINGVKSGFGKIQYANGQKFSGTFRNGKVDGYGTFYKKNGSIVNALWQQNSRKYQTSNYAMNKIPGRQIFYA